MAGDAFEDADVPDIVKAVRAVWAEASPDREITYVEDDLEHVVIRDSDHTTYQVPLAIGATVEFGEPIPMPVSASAEEEITLPNPDPTIIHAAAKVSVDDVRTAYYAQASQRAWIREFHTEPKALIVANDRDGSVARVGFEIDDDGQIRFGEPKKVRVEYVEDDEDEKVAASRLVYASAAESRPDVQAHGTHNQKTHGRRYGPGGRLKKPTSGSRRRDSAPADTGRGESRPASDDDDGPRYLGELREFPEEIQDLVKQARRDPGEVDEQDFVHVAFGMEQADWDKLSSRDQVTLERLAVRFRRDSDDPQTRRAAGDLLALQADVPSAPRRRRTPQERVGDLPTMTRRGVQAAAVSDRPWSDFDESDYSPEQWRRATILDRGKQAGDENTKGRYGLPVREPAGALNRNGVHAAAGGHGIGAVKGISDEMRRTVARKLVRLYSQIGDEPPESLLELAGRSMSASADPQPETPAAEPGNPTNQEEEMPLSTEVLQRLGVAEDADQDTVSAAVLAALDKADQAPDPKAVEAAAAENESLTQKVTLLSEQVASLSQQIADDNAAKKAEVKASVIDEAVTKGRIAPADKDKWEQRYDAAPEAVADVLAAIADGAAVPVQAQGKAGDPWDVAAAELAPEPDWLFSNPEPATVGTSTEEN